MQEEIWATIEECNMYQVSSFGRVRSFMTASTGKFVKQSKSTRGYCTVQLKLEKHKKDVKKFRLHRLVAKYFIDGYSETMHIDHIDENKENNHVSNLRVCTIQENNNFYNSNSSRRIVPPIFNRCRVKVNGIEFQSTHEAAKHIYERCGRDVRLETIRREISAISRQETKSRNMYGQFLIEPAI